MLKCVGELGGIRTHDPLIKSQLLYQLSYEPHAGFYKGMGRARSRGLVRRRAPRRIAGRLLP